MTLSRGVSFDGSSDRYISTLRIHLHTPHNECAPHAHAHAHAHASFISTTTKPLPDSAANTDYDTLNMTAFTTTPICNLRLPGADVRLPCLLSAPPRPGTRARMARRSAKFGSQFGDSCNGVGAAVQVCRCPWLRWLPRQVTCRPDFRAHSAQGHESLGPPCYHKGATVRMRSGVGGLPPYPARGARLGSTYVHV